MRDYLAQALLWIGAVTLTVGVVNWLLNALHESAEDRRAISPELRERDRQQLDLVARIARRRVSQSTEMRS